jgi:hypothetical protein
MKSSMLALAGLTACHVVDEVPKMPWLHGLSDAVASDRSSDELGRRMAEWSERVDYDPACPPGSYPAIQVFANVAPPAGLERIWISLAHGVAVFDHEGQLVSETPGYPCSGSADELEAIAGGDAFGAPTIAIAATTGGHRVSSTWISLLRVSPDRQLHAVFTGTVEERDGETVRRGGVFLLPNALIYRHPDGKPTVWFYNEAARAYLVPGDPVDDSHQDGPSITVSTAD